MRPHEPDAGGELEPVARWRWGEPLQALVERLDAGGFLAIPTESSYGLAADPTSAAGVEAVFRCKGRPPDQALPVVAADREQLEALGVDLSAPLLRRLAALWPAPLSLVAPLSRPLPAAAGGKSLAVRVPAHAGLRDLLSRLGRPLTATSANRSGEPPVLDPDLLVDLLRGSPATIVDAGRLPGGPPSTIVAPRGGRLAILRPGGYPSSRLADFSAAAVEIAEDGSG